MHQFSLVFQYSGWPDHTAISTDFWCISGWFLTGNEFTGLCCAGPLPEHGFLIPDGNVFVHGGSAMLITVRYRQEPDGSLAIVFEDNGAGIPSDRNEKIFLPAIRKNGRSACSLPAGSTVSPASPSARPENPGQAPGSGYAFQRKRTGP
jgi:hypothetical protein